MKKLFLTLSSLFLLASAMVVFAPAEQAAACGRSVDDRNIVTDFFNLPAWHEYLQCEPGGDGVVIPRNAQGELEVGQLWLIGVAVLESIIRVSSLVAIGFIIYGGFKYITSQGAPDATASARKIIISAIVGLGIASFASLSVSFVMRLLIDGGAVTTGTGGLPATSTSGVVQRILRFIYALAGIISVVYIVIGGIKYTTSTGDPGKTASARNTLIYAVVGLIVVLLAVVLTEAVLDRI